MARPRKQIDAEMVDKLAGLGCSAETIAHVVGADHNSRLTSCGPPGSERHGHAPRGIAKLRITTADYQRTQALQDKAR